MAVTGFEAESTQKGVSGVATTFGASGGSSGALPETCPIVRSRSTRPERRTQSAIAGWAPLR